jgi:hypothetical protein
MSTDTATGSRSSAGTARAHGTSLPRGLAAALIFLFMLLAALSLWTAIPLSWIYIGSKVSHTQFPSQGPYAVVAVGIVLTILVDAWLIARLNHLYQRVTGTNRVVAMRPSWLKSLRDSSDPVGTTTVVEAVLMGSVLLAALAFTVWFFLLAGSPLPNS